MKPFVKKSLFNFARVIIYGAVAGLLAVAFRWLLVFFYTNGIARFARFSAGEFLIYSLLSLAGTALLTGTIVRFICKTAAGSGSPQLKLAFWKDFGASTWRVTISKFVASVLAVGGGASLGNEGPMVLIGGTAASNVAGILGVPAHLRREAAAAGAAAGLAAIFNAPMAAVAFVLEEIVENLNSRLVGAVLLAAVVGTLVSQALLGNAPIFSVPAGTGAGWLLYICVPVVAIAASLCGLAFQWTALKIRRVNALISKKYFWASILVGAFSVWVLGSAVFLTTGHLGVFGLGYGDLTEALNGNIIWWVAGTLLLAKIIATAICYGSGACGGIFGPALFFGGTCGAAIAGALAMIVPALSNDALITLAVVGMCAGFAAVVRAPITAVLLVFEMTHEFSMVPALMLGVGIGWALAKWLAPRDFYDVILDQNGESIDKIIPPRDLQAWQHLPIARVMHTPVCVRAGTQNDASFQDLLDGNAFAFFPVVDEKNRPQAVISRERVCLPVCPIFQNATIREAEQALLKQEHGVVLVVDAAGTLVGLFTLHDILRLETNFNS